MSSTSCTKSNAVSRMYRNLPISIRIANIDVNLKLWIQEQVNDSLNHLATHITMMFYSEDNETLTHVYSDNGDGNAIVDRLRAGASAESIDQTSVYGVGKSITESRLCKEGYSSEIQFKKRNTAVVNRLVGPPTESSFRTSKEPIDYDSPEVLYKKSNKEEGFWLHKIQIPKSSIPRVHSCHVEIENRTADELKKLSDELGLKKTGKKEELIDRINKYYSEHPEKRPIYPTPDICKNLYEQIKQILTINYPQSVFNGTTFTIIVIDGNGKVEKNESTPNDPWKCLTYLLETKPDTVVKRWPKDIYINDGCVATTSFYKIIDTNDSDLKAFPNHTVNGCALRSVNGIVNDDIELNQAYGKKSHHVTYNYQLAITNFTLESGVNDLSKLPRVASVKQQLDDGDPIIKRFNEHFKEIKPTDFGVYKSPTTNNNQTTSSSTTSTKSSTSSSTITNVKPPVSTSTTNVKPTLTKRRISIVNKKPATTSTPTPSNQVKETKKDDQGIVQIPLESFIKPTESTSDTSKNDSVTVPENTEPTPPPTVRPSLLCPKINCPLIEKLIGDINNIKTYIDAKDGRTKVDWEKIITDPDQNVYALALIITHLSVNNNTPINEMDVSWTVTRNNCNVIKETINKYVHLQPVLTRVNVIAKN
jgi:hypothetical protein